MLQLAVDLRSRASGRSGALGEVSDSMRILRLRHSSTAGGGSLVTVDYDPGHGVTGYATPVPFLFELNERDRRRLRYYLEDSPTLVDGVSRRAAGGIAAEIRRWGEEMFRQIFLSHRTSQWHYEEAARDLHSLRFEVQSDHPDAWQIPFEILRDPNLGWLAPQVKSFVRTGPRASRGEPPAAEPSPLRILYVVCRSPGGAQVPFQSVARLLLATFGEHRERVQVDLLRPPTFERLAKVLWDAVEVGRAYHVLHFDGHGVFTDRPQDFAGEIDPRFVRQGDRLARRAWASRKGRSRGYLLFEDLEEGENRRLVDGAQLGHLLARTRTPLVLLQSAQAATARIEALERLAAEPAPEGRAPAGGPGEAPDDHDQDLALHSLAQEIAGAGAGAVVAVPWTLPAATAARLAGRLYERLAAGLTVGEAAAGVRTDLRHPLGREIPPGVGEVQDWVSLVVHESAPRPLLEPAGRALEIHAADDLVGGLIGDIGGDLPPAPPWGFVERGEVLFTLDRAFDVHGAVLLHAYAGAGKTAMARAFAVWYHQSGGLDRRRRDPHLEEDPAYPERGVVLWSSFESYNPALPFDAFERVFADSLERAGTPWRSIQDRGRRREIAIDVLRRVPVLWIWDNAEGVAGYPAGSGSPWPAEERRALADFLWQLGSTRCKVLLVSQRPENEWLGTIPYRVALPPMAMEQRVELAARLAARERKSLGELADLRPLLRFSQGNPLTLAVLVKEALREGWRTPEEVERFLADLRFGEAVLANGELGEGPLTASLCYGFEQEFDDEDRRRLSLLHLFQGFVDLNVLCWMGHPESPWCLPEIRGLGREAWIELLDRAVEVGLLTPRGGDHYGIHPALPFFFRGLFERWRADSELEAELAARSFAESVAGLGSWYHAEYRNGNHEVIAGLHAQEANLLHARRLAQRYGWWSAVIHAMQGLGTLYAHTGRKQEWEKLLRETVPVFVDPETESPLPDREEYWEAMAELCMPLRGKDS